MNSGKRFSLPCFATLGLLAAPLASAQQADSNAGIEEVTVTARRVEENLQRTPVTVTAFGVAQLERFAVDNAADLSGRAPNVQIAPVGAGTGAMQVFIRGIGLNALAFNLENPVGVYLDDVYLGRIQGSLLDMLEFERIEILRGPQGTLYGRNSTVGAVKYVSKQPDLEESHFRGAATFGDYSRNDLKFSASVPIRPGELAAKLDVGVRNQDGYIYGVDAQGNRTGELANGVERQSARLSVLWLPSEDWRVSLTADYGIDRSGSSQGTPLISTNGGPCASTVAPCTNLFGSAYEAGLNNANSGRNEVGGASAKVEYDMGWATAKSITAYRYLDGFDAIDFTAVPGAGSLLPDKKDQYQISQELQLASNADQRLTWIGGLYYFRESIQHDSNFVFLQLNDDKQESDSYAVFADATFAITEDFRVNAGARYSYDDKHIDRAVLPTTGGAPIIEGSASFNTNETTYKVGADYTITPDVMVYATYATGYRPGSFASTYAFPPVPAVLLGNTDIETAANLEGGVKSQWLDDRLRFNLTAFDTAYEDLQQQSSTFPYPITTYDIDLKGIEVEVEARPIAALTLFGSLGLLDAEIATGPQAGDRPRYTPKTQYMIGAEYRADLPRGIELFAGVNMVRTSQITTDDANIPSVTQGDYTLTNAQVGLDFEDGKYRVTVDGKNLSDEEYFLATSPDSERFFAPPRMIFVTFAVNL